MPSRLVVLLTPLGSPHPPLSPSSHQINLMNTDFPVVDPLSFQTLTGVHFATHLFSGSSRNGGGCTPLARYNLSDRRCRSYRKGGSPDVQISPKPFTCNIYRPPRKCCIQRTYASAKSFRCNTYKKHTGGCPVAISPFSFSFVLRRRENQAQFDHSAFRVIRRHKLMVSALASSENGMWRRYCPRAAQFFFAPCSEFLSSAGLRGETLHHNANPVKASLRSSSSNRLLSRPTRLTRPHLPPICRPSPRMKARSAIPIFYRAPVSAVSLGKPMPHTPPSPSRRSK